VVNRALLLSVFIGVLAIAACAPKAPPAVAGAPKHPDFMFPVAPDGTLAAQAARLERGWQYLQLDDTRSAEREFSAAIKQQAAFYPAEAAMGYVSMARGNEADALTRFDRALAVDAAYVPALVGRGQALLELDRIGDALASFEAALAKDASLADLKSRVDVLRFRATQDMLGRAKAASDGRRWDEAKAAYQQAIAASPDSAFLIRWPRSITIARPSSSMPAMRDRGPRLAACSRPTTMLSARCRPTSRPGPSTSRKCPTALSRACAPVPR